MWVHFEQDEIVKRFYENHDKCDILLNILSNVDFNDNLPDEIVLAYKREFAEAILNNRWGFRVGVEFGQEFRVYSGDFKVPSKIICDYLEDDNFQMLTKKIKVKTFKEYKNRTNLEKTYIYNLQYKTKTTI